MTIFKAVLSGRALDRSALVRTLFSFEIVLLFLIFISFFPSF